MREARILRANDSGTKKRHKRPGTKQDIKPRKTHPPRRGDSPTMRVFGGWDFCFFGPLILHMAVHGGGFADQACLRWLFSLQFGGGIFFGPLGGCFWPFDHAYGPPWRGDSPTRLVSDGGDFPCGLGGIFFGPLGGFLKGIRRPGAS